MKPLVSVGIPTFNRPELLARALASIAAQDYEPIEVIVADNASDGNETAGTIDAARLRIPGLRHVRHEENIGSIANFRFLLAEARGAYFMWLADDDEVSPNYVSSLLALLESDPAASSAAGHWWLMADERTGRSMPTSSFPQRSAWSRLFRFVWRSDDAFFYGLHRTERLRAASFRGYARPNRGVLLNWAYVYLLDLVLQGPVLLAQDPTVRFLNHDYTLKAYAKPQRPSLGDFAKRAVRRMNVHILFWEKALRVLGPAVLPPVVLVSVVSLVREGTTQAARLVDVPLRQST